MVIIKVVNRLISTDNKSLNGIPKDANYPSEDKYRNLTRLTL